MVGLVAIALPGQIVAGVVKAVLGVAKWVHTISVMGSQGIVRVVKRVYTISIMGSQGSV